MIKKSITYKDFDGVEVTEDFWFHISEADIIDIELSDKKGYSELLKIAQENEDPTIVMDAFRKIVLGGVGRREGARFVKDDEARAALQYTNAFSALVVWMLQNPVEAGDFINGMLPNEAQQALATSKDAIVEKMRATTERMALPEPEVTGVWSPGPPEDTTVPVSAENLENVQAAARPLAADFAAMSPEEFEAWKQNN